LLITPASALASRSKLTTSAPAPAPESSGVQSHCRECRQGIACGKESRGGKRSGSKRGGKEREGERKRERGREERERERERERKGGGGRMKKLARKGEIKTANYRCFIKHANNRFL
jgi:hypothetical protein